MELLVAEASDKAFDEAVLEIQQQVTDYKDRTSQKLQKLEATIEVARKLMLELTKMKAQQLEEGLVHFEPDFGKGNMIQKWPILIEEEIVEWKEELPALKKEKGMFRDTSQIALETYVGEPIYDYEPEEGQECWKGQEFILAALIGDNSNSPDILHSEICASEGLEAYLKNEPNHALEDGDKPKLVGFKGEETHSAIEEEFSIIHTNKREELIEDVPYRDSPTAANAFGLEEKSSHLAKKNMIIFDPGGLMQEGHCEGVNKMFKDIICIKEVKLEKVALINSVCGQPGQWQGKPNFVVQVEFLDGIQGKQGKPGRVLRLEVHEASRKRETITIFDPGGYPRCCVRPTLQED